MLMQATHCAVLTYAPDGAPNGALLPMLPARQSLREWQGVLDSLISAWVSDPNSGDTLPGIYVVTALEDDGVIITQHGRYAESAYTGVPLPQGTFGLLEIQEPEPRLGFTRAILTLLDEATLEPGDAALASVATPWGDLVPAESITKQDFTMMRMSSRELAAWLHEAPRLP